MPYSPNSDPYIDPVTGVMKNLLGIDNAEVLEWAEADISTVIIASLADRPVTGALDLNHLKDLHYEIFNAIYPWAGEIRLSEITKGNTRFANSYVIEQAADNLFEELHRESLLKDRPRERYLERLAHYYSEVNVLHPLREGMGVRNEHFLTRLPQSQVIVWHGNE